MAHEEQILFNLKQIQNALQRLQSDMDKIKKTVLTEAQLEEEQLELEKEMDEIIKPDPQIRNEVRYNEESLDEVEKELGK